MGPEPSAASCDAGDRFHALYVLALCLGLRRGELLGLRWQDVDLDAGRLEAAHTLQLAGGALRPVPPKTGDSSHTVPLPDLCVKALREHRKRQSAERSDAAPGWDENGLVFPSRRRTPLEPDNLRRSWEPLHHKACLDGARPPQPPAHLRDAAIEPRSTAPGGPGDRRTQRHRRNDDDLRAHVPGRQTENAGKAQGSSRLTPLPSTAIKKARTVMAPGFFTDRAGWPGAGSNRRPSAFQADARTN
ncbi:hypothetical protein GCM10027294_49490 [Marinactinospora endophytica]